MISNNELKPDLLKIEIMESMKTPTNIKEVRQFSEITRFYKRLCKSSVSYYKILKALDMNRKR